MDQKKPDFFYLIRRAKWLEEKVARGDPNSPGQIFDTNELAELKAAFRLMGVPYEPAARRGGPEEPPRMDAPYPRAQPAKGRSRSRDVDERDFGGMFIPGGL